MHVGKHYIYLRSSNDLEDNNSKVACTQSRLILTACMHVTLSYSLGRDINRMLHPLASMFKSVVSPGLTRYCIFIFWSMYQIENRNLFRDRNSLKLNTQQVYCIRFILEILGTILLIESVSLELLSRHRKWKRRIEKVCCYTLNPRCLCNQMYWTGFYQNHVEICPHNDKDLIKMYSVCKYTENESQFIYIYIIFCYFHLYSLYNTRLNFEV